MPSLYVNSRACVGVGNSVIGFLSSSSAIGLCDATVVIKYMDGVVKEVKARMFGRGVSLMSDDCIEWNVIRLFANDTPLAIHLEEEDSW